MTIEYLGNAQLLMRREGLSESEINRIISDQNEEPLNERGTTAVDGRTDHGRTVKIVYSQEPSQFGEGPNVDAVVMSTMVLE